MQKTLRHFAAPAFALSALTIACTGTPGDDVTTAGELGGDGGVEPSGADAETESGPASCYGAPSEPSLTAGYGISSVAQPARGELDPLFAEVAREFEIPERVLKAVAYAETQFTMFDGHRHHGMPAAYGMMALQEDSLRRGAELAEVSAERAKHDERESLRAGAALLDAAAAELGIDRADVHAWAPAIADVSGLDSDQAIAMHLERVYDILREGITTDSETGTVRASLAADPSVEAMPADDGYSLQNAPDYPPAIWRPSPNYNSRPAGRGERKVIVHTCEGGYAGCWGWLTNPSAPVSAHYVVSESGHEISQLVRNTNRAWHIGATYDCNKNSGVSCDLNGVSSNDFTIGIEHAGSAKQSSFPTGQIQASAELACAISQKHNIPLDEFHFVGHGQLQPENRTDPGPNWPWTEYLDRAKETCGEGAAGGIIIDSNNNRNNDNAVIEVSDAWTPADATAGYYGTGYYFSDTDGVCDPARFWFHLDEGGERTIEAWWTAGDNRSPNAPFIAFDADGNEVGTAHANQRENGSRWVELGTWEFSAGWNQVVLSRDTDGDVVIADAIRVR